MLIHAPNTDYATHSETLILKPSYEYELPIVLVDPMSITPADEEIMSTLAEYAPRTKYKRGDLAMLKGEIPTKMRMTFDKIPRVWEVRFVVSKWAMEAMLTLHSRIDVQGPDHLRSIISSHGGLPESRFDQPMIYAHGYPHGLYPNTAAWLSEWSLKRLAFRDPIQPWRNIVEEAGANFYGYDASSLRKPYNFELAPDDYSHGSNLGAPFVHEEENVETLCLSGFEEQLFDPIIIGQKRKLRRIDEEHPVFAGPSPTKGKVL